MIDVTSQCAWFVSSINAQRMKIFALLVERGSMSSADLAEHLDVNEPYVRTLISPFVILGLVHKQGKGKKIKPIYTMTPELRDWFHATVQLCSGRNHVTEQVSSEADHHERD